MAKEAGLDRGEEGFDSWTPRRSSKASDDTGVDLDREALLRLARELAEKRQALDQDAGVELEQLKQSLRDRAEAIAARERELAKLQKRFAQGKPRKQEQPDAVDTEALVARERAALERAHALEGREQELRKRAVQLEAESDRVATLERELAAELARAQAQLHESLSERELANAERAKLEERAEEARHVEKQLAARRIELEAERDRLEARARDVKSHDREPEPADPRESELRRLEDRLDVRERELALLRQGLDAERNALLERERALRRREIADVRQSFEEPFAAPSFSEGLAAFVSSRLRR
jgi:hypothetical protein